MSEKLKQESLMYFEYFSNKELKLIEEMLSPVVVLKDWDIHAKGKQEVIYAIEKIFKNVDIINIDPVKLYSDGEKIIAELEIEINNSIKQSVLDIITYDENMKISYIRAYKG